MKHIAFIFTGGTISMKFDPAIGAAVPALSGKEILDNVVGLEGVVEPEIIDFGRLPGPHVTSAIMMELSRQVAAVLERSDVAGIVVTHGTDSLEETAFLLDLTLTGDKPVVFVGAMRTSSEQGWDGPANLLSAARVAAADSARGLGVLVVMNESILAASEATKTHTESFDSFQSPDFGPLGVVDRGEVLIRRRPLRREFVDAAEPAEPVFLLKVHAGFDATLPDACLKAGATGIVIEGMGRGNVPPACVPSIERAIAAQIPVVLTSRCPRGRVFDSYGYSGGGRHLRHLGVIFADFLNGPKARIKLALALGATRELDRIRNLFERPPSW